MLEQQLALEKEMLDAGVARYHRIKDTAEKAGRAAETTYAQRLMPNLCIDLAGAIEDAKHPKKKAGCDAKYVALLKRIDSNQAAYLTLRVVLDSLTLNTNLTALSITLGTRIEDQIRFERFEKANEKYYKSIMEDFKRKGTTAYRHMHRVLVKKAREKEDGWIDWTPNERIHLGCKLIELCILSTGIIEKVTVGTGNKRVVCRIQATEDALEWIQDHVKHAELLHPEHGPCIIPPLDWVGLNDGGYFSAGIQRRTPFIKTKSATHRKAIADYDFKAPMKAVNIMQRTGWGINKEVHNVLKEVWRRNLGIGLPKSEPSEIPQCPIAKEIAVHDLPEGSPTRETFMAWKRDAAAAYGEERERVAKSIQLSRVFSMAEKYRAYAAFYFVYTCDFRGRVYATSPGLSPQGADFSKGLLHFAKGKELGASGGYWLGVHGANTFGYDKDTYDGRVEWVKEHEDVILAIATNPLGSEERSFWCNADKPYQFLAFCFEWRGYTARGDKHISHIPVALDGSCNGLQNFSALLRDRVGGTATNLTKGTKPQDIYQRVADVCIKRLQSSDDEMAIQWLGVGITRKICKKPVMTLPYGSTKQSCRESIELFLRDKPDKHNWDQVGRFKAAAYLARLMWESIGEVVIAARAAMTWLQKASRQLSKVNVPIAWTTPTGFRVYQGILQSRTLKVSTQLCGRLQLRTRVDLEKIDAYKQANGVAPNFVHSLDASHLMCTIISGDSKGIEAWAMIHDDYGTYAADAALLGRVLRGAFCSMYEHKDWLAGWKHEQEELAGIELPELPETGDLSMKEVLEAAYFFG